MKYLYRFDMRPFLLCRIGIHLPNKAKDLVVRTYYGNDAALHAFDDSHWRVCLRCGYEWWHGR